MIRAAQPTVSPYDEAAWGGVAIVSGGLPAPTLAAVRAHWVAQGVPEVVIDYFLMQPPEKGMVYTTEHGKFAFTHRAVDDALAVQEAGKLAAEAAARVAMRACDTCHRATPGNRRYGDTEFHCDGRTAHGERPFSDARWKCAWRWRESAFIRCFNQANPAEHAAHWGEFSSTLDRGARGCPEWYAKQE